MNLMQLLNLKQIGWRIVWGSALLAATPAIVGCTPKPDSQDRDLTGIPGEQFDDSNKPRHFHHMMDTQAASGARNDATLYASHFDLGDPAALNSLGEQKLELMLADDDALPLVVYLDAASRVTPAPADEAPPATAPATRPAGPTADDEARALADARAESIKIFLRDHGLRDEQVKIVVGPNAQTFSPTGPRLKDAAAADAKKLSSSQGGTAGGTTVK